MRNSVCAAGLFVLVFAAAGRAQVCAHARRPGFYNGYRVAAVRTENPFGFMFAASARLAAIQQELRTQAGGAFSAGDFERDFKDIEALARGSVFGDSPFTFVAATGTLVDCDEEGRTLSVVFRVVSANPTPTITYTFGRTASEAARSHLTGNVAITPSIGYDATRRLFAGGGLRLGWNGPVFDSLGLTGSGSTSSSVFEARLRAARMPRHAALDHFEYQAGYLRSEVPSRDLVLRERRLYARFTAATKAGAGRRWSARYGGSLEGGHTQSTAAGLPEGLVGAGSYGALKLYGTVDQVSRRQETAIAYGLQMAGSGAQLDFTKHVGSARWTARIPGLTHRPWEFEIRAAAGGITGLGPVHLSERFFGGNVARQFIQSPDLGLINGPLVRSIPENRISGAGYGGDRFYSVNNTVAKVLWHKPLIPREVEETPGFGDALSAGIKTAQTFLQLHHKSKSPEFAAVLKRGEALGNDLRKAQEEWKAIRSRENLTAAQKTALATAERLAKRSLAITGRRPEQLRALVIPATSPVFKLIPAMRTLETSFPGSHSAVIERDVAALDEALRAIDSGPADKAARERAEADMLPVQHAIETLRFEVNSLSLGVVGAFDAGRVWPDPAGTRYGVGGGVRVGVFNLNLTAGYAWNPNRRKDFGEGRGALFFSLTYVNLLR